MASRRDAALERDFLVRSAGHEPFTDAVLQRLGIGQQLYGERSLGRPLDELLHEIREETLDIGAWSLVALQSTGLAVLDAGPRELVVDALEEATLAGSAAERAIRRVIGQPFGLRAAA
jgi:hypothetical protein